jgi:DNA-directed RNA polymerase subunit RPC12/RpoP
METIRLDPKIYTCVQCGSHNIQHVVPGCIVVFSVLSLSKTDDEEVKLEEGPPAVGDIDSVGWFECADCGDEVPSRTAEELFEFLKQTKNLIELAEAVEKAVAKQQQK